MKLGLDFYNVITQFPHAFGSLADAVIKSGGEVYIISAVSEKKLHELGGQEAYRQSILQYNIPHTDILVVVVDPWLAPQAKLEKCRQLGITIMVDDREDIVDFLFENGVVALRLNVGSVPTIGDIVASRGKIRPGFLRGIQRKNRENRKNG